MYKLVSSFFLTAAETDMGFPAFQSSRENRLFTCTLNKALEIESFVPVYLDKFHNLEITNQRSFLLGDKFPFLFFRIGGKALTIDLVDASNKLDEILAEHARRPFVRLQIARHFANKNRPRAIQAISDAANCFDLDEESKLSFISSETSLASFEQGAWGTSEPSAPQAFANDAYFSDFEKIDKAAAIQLLQNRRFKTSDHWPFLFVVYASRFGYDEFLFILAKDFLLKLASHERLPTAIVARVVKLTFEFQFAELRDGKQVDRDFKETIEELIDTDVFAVLSKNDPSLVGMAFRIVTSPEDRLELAHNLLDFILEGEDWIPPAAVEELTNSLREAIRRLDLNELRDFASTFELEEEDRDRLSARERDKKRLLLSVQARLTRLLRFSP